MNLYRKDFAAFGEERFDLLVIGGGIVGAGVARDAALRGLRVALIEQGDFASGTSSRSSRLLHGGIRYLAQGRVGLVREASVEKEVLARIAPHLAQPLAFILPSYRGSGWPLWQLRVGVKLYDLLCSGRNLGRSSSLSKRKTLDSLPGVSAEGLRGAVRYYDAFTNDARLVLDTLQSASQAGALVGNYVRSLDCVKDAGGGWRCTAADRLHGSTVEIRARAIVNATGPWAEGFGKSSVKLRLTKGVHIVVERSRVGFDDAVVITVKERILFVIPWGERTIVGTTDTDFAGLPEEVRVETADVRYLLDAVNRFLPSTELQECDVISAWAGLRPLIAEPGGRPSDISRSHEIRNPDPGWWDVAGGKLTTYRLMAEQVVDRIIASEQLKAAPCQSATQPLPCAAPLGNGVLPPECTRESVEYFCNHEWVVHLDDLMVRRTSWHYYYRSSAALALAERAAVWMGELLGWSEKQRLREIERYCALAALPFGIERSAIDSEKKMRETTNAFTTVLP